LAWSLLAQPESLPARILAAAAEAIIDHALGGWGSAAEAFPAEVRAAYLEALRDPAHAHAICEEYRAAAGIDRLHDQADRKAARKIRAPVLALWSAEGPLDSWYNEGPVALWRDWADDVSGYAIKGGHFFPEAAPAPTADALRRFFATRD
jgi:haloacetate dehalogenase